MNTTESKFGPSLETMVSLVSSMADQVCHGRYLLCRKYLVAVDQVESIVLVTPAIMNEFKYRATVGIPHCNCEYSITNPSGGFKVAGARLVVDPSVDDWKVIHNIDPLA